MLVKVIQDACAERGISIARLEKECGLGNATIRKWDKSSPKVSSVKKVSDYLEIPLCKLLENYDG